jgi:transcriptional regulator with XRE-family HTH domain
MLANLKAALAARNMLQADLAYKLKISPSAMSEIVNGRRNPEPRVAARIAQILRVDESLLFSEQPLILVTPVPQCDPSDATGQQKVSALD